ncbi:carbohydrate ABC transporter permease [Candidatus Sordicultor fermentans]|jgi:multiple sugar transport system permease protein|uniref:carbohydrate ABC transporter permease n=1 Tax=Candidatus Sordicultor fermentans TaxID=1953203 RepID=UPI001695791B|nr:sugar ABC transporter permease [Atribacterota bacterium]MDI9607581.1 sugar ABC transporter permease [Atribacterota bacterium]NLY05171.1 sugar ABC transporter permease [Candidatus Atribacteria bacterium]HOA98932.1 sugar ABC transporter permease [Candidatus Atribacteria bacterium]
MAFKKESIVPYLYLLPWVIGFILFTGGPIIAAIFISFTKWDLLSPPVWVGLANFTNMFRAGSEFWGILKVTLIFMVFSVIITMCWSLFTALLLNQKVRGTGVFSFFYFAPAVVPLISLTFVFQLMFSKELGIVNYLLSLTGIEGPNWLMDSRLVLWVVTVLCIYTYFTGQMMLIFDSALKEVPKELYEAAEIDGANAVDKFFKITIPAISPIFFFNLVTGTINSLNTSFALIYPLTGGGPGKATQVMSLDIYVNAFKNFRMGYASAEAVILFAITAALSLLQFRLAKKWVYYEA